VFEKKTNQRVPKMWLALTWRFKVISLENCTWKKACSGLVYRRLGNGIIDRKAFYFSYIHVEYVILHESPNRIICKIALTLGCANHNMKYWRFMDYWTGDNPSRNLIREWYLAEDVKVQAEFENVINFLEGQKNWDGLHEIQPLEKGHLGLWEIRFTITETKKRLGRPFWRYRPVGFQHGSRQFVFLRGCKKWMASYKPAECFDLALDLKKQFDQGRGTIRDHEF
jgi:hypothetical protein